VTGSSRTAAQLRTIGWLHAVLTERDLDHWVFGGWAVDLHLGETTREHADVDVAVWEVDRGAIEALLLGAGWSHRPDPAEDGYTAYARDDVRLELAFLARAGDGTVHTPLVEGAGWWGGRRSSRTSPALAPTRRPPRRTASTSLG
jgi:Aminoglycoside-2''-adenylyltransferase